LPTPERCTRLVSSVILRRMPAQPARDSTSHLDPSTLGRLRRPGRGEQRRPGVDAGAWASTPRVSPGPRLLTTARPSEHTWQREASRGAGHRIRPILRSTRRSCYGTYVLTLLLPDRLLTHHPPATWPGLHRAKLKSCDVSDRRQLRATYLLELSKLRVEHRPVNTRPLGRLRQRRVRQTRR
jgi:hypothetical protein